MKYSMKHNEIPGAAQVELRDPADENTQDLQNRVLEKRELPREPSGAAEGLP